MLKITDGTVHLFTYKEGLLAAVAHDLRLRVTRFEVTLDNTTIRAQFWPKSIEIDGAIKNGAVDSSTLSRKDLADINGYLLGKKILNADKYSCIELEAELQPRDAGLSLSGSLSLVGRTAPVNLEVIADGGRLRGEVTLTPTKWGIAPFKALLGTLKIQDRVRVVFDLPDPR